MGSEAAAGGYDIERPVLSVSFLGVSPPHPFLEVLWIEIDFLVVVWIFFRGRMVSIDKLAYSPLLYKRRRLYFADWSVNATHHRFTISPSGSMPKYGKSAWLSFCRAATSKFDKFW